MNKKLLFGLTTIALLLFSSISFSQALSLGETLPPFAAYTGDGAVTVEGELGGDAGSHLGILGGAGFGPQYIYTKHSTGDITYKAKVDLLRLYIHLSDVFVTFPNSHAPAFGGDETIFPGVYSISGAGSIAGSVTLDGQGDPNAYFILKFDGAFTVGLGAEVKLTGGTRAANVFWIAEGAIEVGSDSDLKGTLISHPGAITIGANTHVEGRLLATEGAIIIEAGGSAYLPEGESTIPINCTGLCSPNSIVDVLGSLDQYALFTSDGAVSNAATSGIVGNIGTNNGPISGFTTSTHVGFFKIPSDETILAAQELSSAYAQLMAIPNTELGHSGVFGSGETVFPGVYYMAGAGSIAGTVTLDAQNNPNAIFVFKFGAAFSIGAQSKVIFKNGARRCNVFWIAEGAIEIGTFSHLKGTFISHTGAVTMAANGVLGGRLLSMSGAIGFSTGVIYNDTLCFEDPYIDGQDYEGCFEDGLTLTSTAIVGSTNQNVVWYDAETGGNVVASPTLEGVGTVTYWARAFNGAYFGEQIVPSTLTIVNCDFDIVAMDDIYRPIQEVDQITTFENLVTINDTLGVGGDPVTSENSVVTPVTEGPLSIDAEGTLTLEANTLPGTYTIIYQLCQLGSGATNCDTATVTVIVSIIDAVDDTTEPVNGLTGGDTEPLTLNDTITIDAEVAVVIGTNPGDVILTGTTVPDGFILNPDGTVTIPANTLAGDYEVIYQICEVDNPINCDSATATIVVSSPDIEAVVDALGPIDGTTGGTDIVNVLTNDILNGSSPVINDVDLTTVTADPEGVLTLNPDGSVNVAENTSTGTYTLTYQICEKSNPTNCSQAEVVVEVIRELPDFTPTIDIEGLVFLFANDTKDFIVNISEIKDEPSDGQVVVEIIKGDAFLITAKSNITIGGNTVTTNNDDWTIVEGQSFITMTLNTDAIIGANLFSSIGFEIKRNEGVPTQTTQSITVTIVNESGGDSYNNNNTYNTVVQAQ
jgi:hypothetical protein